jgi:hypothetical protein
LVFSGTAFAEGYHEAASAIANSFMLHLYDGLGDRRALFALDEPERPHRPEIVVDQVVRRRHACEARLRGTPAQQRSVALFPAVRRLVASPPR